MTRLAGAGKEKCDIDASAGCVEAGRASCPSSFAPTRWETHRGQTLTAAAVVSLDQPQQAGRRAR